MKTQRPFLKWAGGKQRLVARIQAWLPADRRRLIEPFVGSGALFLGTDYPGYLLADSNGDLINLYEHLQREGEPFIAACRPLFGAATNQPAAYYALREEFNAAADPRRRAVLFLYLNRHGYNGLSRYNSKGGFNVPFGRYKRPYFPAAQMAYFVDHARRAVFRRADFAATMADAGPGDVVYCDPPYVPLSATANFTSYSAGGFDVAAQRRLAMAAETVAERGVRVVISNHDLPLTRALYAAAHTIETLRVRRSISRDGSGRGTAAELLAIYG